MAKRQCKGQTKSGKACRAAPLSGSDYCLAHADEVTRDSTGFGGSQPGAGRPRVARVTEVMRAWVEDHAEELLHPYLEALGATLIDTVIVGEGESMRYETHYPDHDMRMKAAEKLQDRAVGRPRQRIEHAGGEDLAPVSVEFKLNEQTREAIADALRGRPASSS